jgi:hypothetical protein
MFNKSGSVSLNLYIILVPKRYGAKIASRIEIFL